MTTTANSRPAAPQKRRSYNQIAAHVVLIGLTVLGAWSVYSIGISVGTLVQSADNAANFISRMFPLDFPPIGELAWMIAETLGIVFLATALAVILSIPVSIWAARPTSPNSTVHWLSRAFIVLMRAIPDLILAILFLRVFGLGALGGILAMGLHSIGMIGKLYSDAIEELDDGPREAIESNGAGRNQQIWSAIPQKLMPQIIATALHRFDINLRTSVLLGYVGVGGIGQAIADSLRVLDYQRGMALAIVVLVLCIAVELISGMLRAAIMSRSSSAPSWRQSWSDKLFGRKKNDSDAQAAEPELTINPPWTAERVNRVLAVATIVILTVVSWSIVDLSFSEFITGLANLPESLALFLPPSDGGIAAEIFQLMLDTLQIAFAATFLGAILAIPIGILAARNVVMNKWVNGVFRMFIVVVRGIPELILAIVFVVISGLGAVAGTLALALGAVGLLSKLIADSIEETDVEVQEAVRAGGASNVQVFFAATIRQAAPAFVAHTLYLLDNNIRSATLLGVVGAGGIGFQLLNASRVNQFDVVTYILIVMVAVVLAVEVLSMWLRKAVR